MITKEEIKKTLPHGYLKKIADKAGVSKTAVTNYFNDKTKSSAKIEKAAMECSLEYLREKKESTKEFKKLSENE